MADLGEEGGISRSPSASTSQRRCRGRAAAGGGGPVVSRSDGWKFALLAMPAKPLLSLASSLSRVNRSTGSVL
jgi:hypothetical protein